MTTWRSALRRNLYSLVGVDLAPGQTKLNAYDKHILWGRAALLFVLLILSALIVAVIWLVRHIL